MTTEAVKETIENKDTFETGCCPRFHPEEWQEKKIIYDEKLFLKDHVNSLLHMPLNFGKVMKRDMDKIEKEKAVADSFVLTDEKSPWRSDIFIGVDKEITNAEMTRISGTFLSKVFEGPYKNMSEYVKEMNEYVEGKEKKIKKQYFGYPYCPNCAKAYGKNYIVILAQI